MALFKPLSNILLLLRCHIYFFASSSFDSITFRNAYGMECVSMCQSYACTLVRFQFHSVGRAAEAMNEPTNTHFFICQASFSTHIYGFLTVFNFFSGCCLLDPTLCAFDELMYVSFTLSECVFGVYICTELSNVGAKC